MSGRINVSTAPREVLGMIKELTSDDVEAIITARQGLDSATKSSPAWLVTQGVISEYKFRRILEKITPGQILAGGLSTSAVIVAWKAADAAVSSPELFLQSVAETLRPISLGTGLGIGGGLLLLATALAAKWGLLDALKRRRAGSGRGAQTDDGVPLPGR